MTNNPAGIPVYGDSTQIDVLADMATRVRHVNVENGWYDANRSIGDGMALLHSEVSEAYDAWRKTSFEQTYECDWEDNTFSGTHEHVYTCKPTGYGSELADVLIRLLDQADRDGVDLHAEFERKLAYNTTRGYRHGGRAV
jgi:NTP pyrophosphatase (non-canonical NTP hydrolase)